jgi:hypothetical protein
LTTGRLKIEPTPFAPANWVIPYSVETSELRVKLPAGFPPCVPLSTGLME